MERERSGNRGERTEHRVSGNGAVSRGHRKRCSVSGARGGRWRSGNGVESGGSKNALSVERLFCRSRSAHMVSMVMLREPILKLKTRFLHENRNRNFPQFHFFSVFPEVFHCSMIFYFANIRQLNKPVFHFKD